MVRIQEADQRRNVRFLCSVHTREATRCVLVLLDACAAHCDRATLYLARKCGCADNPQIGTSSRNTLNRDRKCGFPYFRWFLGRFAFAAPFGERPFGRSFGAAGMAALLTLTAAASIMFLMWAA